MKPALLIIALLLSGCATSHHISKSKAKPAQPMAAGFYDAIVSASVNWPATETNQAVEVGPTLQIMLAAEGDQPIDVPPPSGVVVGPSGNSYNYNVANGKLSVWMTGGSFVSWTLTPIVSSN